MDASSSHRAVLEVCQLLDVVDTPWGAARDGKVSILRDMATWGTPLDVPDQKRNWRPCMYAAAQDQLDALEYLVEQYGVDLNRVDDEQPSLVWIAASAGSLRCLEYIVSCGSHHLDTDHHDESPLEMCNGPPANFAHDMRLGRAAELLILAGCHVTAGFIRTALRPRLMYWAQNELRSYHAPTALACCARHGRVNGGERSVLARLDGLEGPMETIAAFLKRPRKQRRRVERALWVMQSEQRDETSRATAIERGFSRDSHCFHVM